MHEAYRITYQGVYLGLLSRKYLNTEKDMKCYNDLTVKYKCLEGL